MNYDSSWREKIPTAIWPYSLLCTSIVTPLRWVGDDDVKHASILRWGEGALGKVVAGDGGIKKKSISLFSVPVHPLQNPT